MTHEPITQFSVPNVGFCISNTAVLRGLFLITWLISAIRIVWRVQTLIFSCFLKIELYVAWSHIIQLIGRLKNYHMNKHLIYGPFFLDVTVAETIMPVSFDNKSCCCKDH